MKFRIVIGQMALLMSCFYNGPNSKDNLQLKNARNQQNWSDKLIINNGQYRGTVYTDSLGDIYNIRYMPITITNDDIIPIHLQISFAKEYDFPIAASLEKFNVFPLPIEWANDGAEISDSMIDQLPKYISEPILNKTLEPNEKNLFAIGTLYRRGKTGGLLPKFLFIQNDQEIFSECDWLMNEHLSSMPQLSLGLKFSISGSCFKIPCGKISHPGQ